MVKKQAKSILACEKNITKNKNTDNDLDFI
jgi:hypothetical protein